MTMPLRTSASLSATAIRTPSRRIFSGGCCARTTNGQRATAPLSKLTKSRRLIASPEARTTQRIALHQCERIKLLLNDSNVRFTPDGDRESGHRQPVMSALPPIADMCGASGHVCYGPKADIRMDIDAHCVRTIDCSVTFRPGLSR